MCVSYDVEFYSRTLKNADFKVLEYEKDGEVLLRFAVANGFRNIQNLVQKMKRRRCDFDFVEVMACPSGCLNGGAQSRPAAGGGDGGTQNVTGKETVAALEEAFRRLDSSSAPEENAESKRLYSDWLGGRHSDKASALLRTDYHEVEKMTNSLAIKW